MWQKGFTNLKKKKLLPTVIGWKSMKMVSELTMNKAFNELVMVDKCVTFWYTEELQTSFHKNMHQIIEMFKTYLLHLYTRILWKLQCTFVELSIYVVLKEIIPLFIILELPVHILFVWHELTKTHSRSTQNYKFTRLNLKSWTNLAHTMIQVMLHDT